MTLINISNPGSKVSDLRVLVSDLRVHVRHLLGKPVMLRGHRVQGGFHDVHGLGEIIHNLLRLIQHQAALLHLPISVPFTVCCPCGKNHAHGGGDATHPANDLADAHGLSHLRWRHLRRQPPHDLPLVRVKRRKRCLLRSRINRSSLIRHTLHNRRSDAALHGSLNDNLSHTNHHSNDGCNLSGNLTSQQPNDVGDLQDRVSHTDQGVLAAREPGLLSKQVRCGLFDDLHGLGIQVMACHFIFPSR
uniref:Uncharacterized protein n=1 Tax=Siphoviridae sp. ct3CA7 TaxID=2823561 RepID=A0A8S5LFB5_9CAUD|nr:MAG TPA: hypothetical protein [Siphoviridae sp. ct3CA7]